MKKMLTVLVCLITVLNIKAQQAPDQNPDFATSRAKYMGGKDSLLKYMGATSQQTYKAYDYMEEKERKKEEKTAFKRQLKLTRAMGGAYPAPYQSGYNGYSNYNYGYPGGSYYQGTFWDGFKPLAYSLPWLGLGYLLAK